VCFSTTGWKSTSRSWRRGSPTPRHPTLRVLARGFFVIYDGIGLPTLEPPGVTPRPPPIQEGLDQHDVV
jgi:hypothetical protein